MFVFWLVVAQKQKRFEKNARSWPLTELSEARLQWKAMDGKAPTTCSAAHGQTRVVAGIKPLLFFVDFLVA
jgi:hypothetical protein